MSFDYRTGGSLLDETILRESPIFAHLALLWSDAGRMVPGQADQEWHHLTDPPRFAPRAPGIPPAVPAAIPSAPKPVPKPETAQGGAQYPGARA